MDIALIGFPLSLSVPNEHVPSHYQAELNCASLSDALSPFLHFR